jgi:hypothetical protein
VSFDVCYSSSSKKVNHITIPVEVESNPIPSHPMVVINGFESVAVAVNVAVNVAVYLINAFDVIEYSCFSVR